MTQTKAAEVARHPWSEAVRRAGWAAKGLVYGLITFVCTRVAFGAAPARAARAQDASSSGAIHLLASRPYGTALLAVLAIGMFGFAVDRVLESTLLANPRTNRVERLFTFGNGLLWLVLGVVAALTAVPGRADDPGATTEPAGVTGTVLAWSVGPWLVAAVGLGFLAYAVYETRKGLDGSALRELNRSTLGPGPRRAVEVITTLGVAGHGLAFGLIGYFLIQAAVTHDASKAESLDSALLRFSGAPLGTVVIVATAAGLLLYAVFCILQAAMRRLAT